MNLTPAFEISLSGGIGGGLSRALERASQHCEDVGRIIGDEGIMGPDHREPIVAVHSDTNGVKVISDEIIVSHAVNNS
jgi:hypothetical protein